MSDPRRLTEAGCAFQRELLLSANRDRSRAAVGKAKVLAGVAAGSAVGIAAATVAGSAKAAVASQVANAGAAVGNATSAVGAGSAGVVSLVKWALIGMVASGVTLGATQSLRSRDVPRPSMVGVQASAPPAAVYGSPTQTKQVAVAAEPSSEPEKEPAKPSRSAVPMHHVDPQESPPVEAVVQAPAAAPASSGSASSADRTVAERLAPQLALLENARHALEMGRPGDALRWVERYRTEFPSGDFLPEADRIAREASGHR